MRSETAPPRFSRLRPGQGRPPGFRLRCSSPEILEADLAPLALDLAAAGIRDPAELRWLDPPPPAAFAEARSLLGQLGAVDGSGGFTRHGAAMTRLALHPRLSHMVMKASELGARDTACEMAALLTERDLLRRNVGVPEADIRTRLDVLRGATVRQDVDREALRRARAEVAVCRRVGRGRSDRGGTEVGAGALLGLAYPDRIAQRREGQVGRSRPAGPGGRSDGELTTGVSCSRSVEVCNEPRMSDI